MAVDCLGEFLKKDGVEVVHLLGDGGGWIGHFHNDHNNPKQVEGGERGEKSCCSFYGRALRALCKMLLGSGHAAEDFCSPPCIHLHTHTQHCITYLLGRPYPSPHDLPLQY